MERALYEKILNEASSFARRLKYFRPFFLGEPLLHPEFRDLIKLTRNKLPDCIIQLRTNCEFLGEMESRAILNASVNELALELVNPGLFSLEERDFEKKLSNIFRNIDFFLKLKAKQGASTEIKLLVFSNSPIGEKTLNEIRNIESQVGKVIFASPTFEEMTEQKISRNERGSHRSSLNREIIIGWDGRITFHRKDYNFNNEVGNIRNQPLREIWKSKRPLYKTFIEIPETKNFQLEEHFFHQNCRFEIIK
ncbi:MAG: SPASM domain-containing protein [Candidatus Riflebacteria bacterium]|nr:SPASM domain-containing protein [Candidatus Riflebacteria bacterium]